MNRYMQLRRQEQGQFQQHQQQTHFQPNQNGLLVCTGASTAIATIPSTSEIVMAHVPMTMAMPLGVMPRPMPAAPLIRCPVMNARVLVSLPHLHEVFPSSGPGLSSTQPLLPVRGCVYLDSPSELDILRTNSLEKFLRDQGLLPSQEEELKRQNILEQLEQIVNRWIRRVAWQRGLPKEIKESCSAKIFIFGSYKLGVHGPDADIDAVCVGPSYATLEEDFFWVLFNMLKSITDISEVQCVKSANVPLMRFNFNDISIDLLYARLNFPSIPKNLDILDERLLGNLDDTSIKSLSGCKATEAIVHLVPNIEDFCVTLRFIRFWAKRRGIYSQIIGYLGGIHWAILVAYICQLFPCASVSILVSNFFRIYANWQWSVPVKLLDNLFEHAEEPERSQFMSIMLPVAPYTSCSYNVTRSTKHKITCEFSRASACIAEMESNWTTLPTSVDWNKLFEPFPHFTNYGYYIQIYITAPDMDDLRSWKGWVESRLRYLLLKFEKMHTRCDPNSSSFFDERKKGPHCYFFWGLNPNDRFNVDMLNVDMLALEQTFKEHLNNMYQGPSGCNIHLTLLNRFQLPGFVHCESSELPSSKPYWTSESNLHRTPVYSRFSPGWTKTLLKRSCLFIVVERTKCNAGCC